MLGYLGKTGLKVSLVLLELELFALEFGTTLANILHPGACTINLFTAVIVTVS